MAGDQVAAKTRGRKRVYDGKGAPEFRFRAESPAMAEAVAARVVADGAKDVSAWLREAVRLRLGRCEACGAWLFTPEERLAGRCGKVCADLPPQHPQ